jgi:hypothetical protein
MTTPFPEDEYVLAIGKLAYAVSYLEWGVLGDLPHISGLPQELSLERLAGLSTGQIAKRLKEPAVLAKVIDVRLREWLSLAGDILAAASSVRNSILHARPATIGGHQRLYRWDPVRGETFAIEATFLADALGTVERGMRELSAHRYIDVGNGM